MGKQLETTLSQGEYHQMQEKLLSLLSRQLQRFTMGDSSSVPVELAQTLFQGLCCCLGISADPGESWKGLLEADLEEVYQQALAELEGKKRQGEQLWQMLCLDLPPVVNVSMMDTLKSIGGFWKRYDSRFFAHEIPCDIDYPLALPVSESVQGVDYVGQYLGNLFCENRFLSRYSAEAMVPVLERYCPDYKGLLVNFFEPIAAVALGLAALGSPAAGLFIGMRELACLSDLFARKERAGIMECLLQGLERLDQEQKLTPEVRAYMARYCGQLAARIDGMRACGGLGGIFCASEVQSEQPPGNNV